MGILVDCLGMREMIVLGVVIVVGLVIGVWKELNDLKDVN